MSGRLLPCDATEIGSLFLFEKLTPEQLGRLCAQGRVERFEPGPVYTEGEPATCFYVMLEGTLVLYRRVGTDDVEVTRTAQRGVYAGAMQAYIGDRVRQVYNNSMRVTEPTRFFVLPADTFASIMQEWFPMAVHLLEGLFFGAKNTQRLIGQRERLLALGSLSAGLTHELNNPAAAAVRATATLRERVAKMRHKLGVISAGPYAREALAELIEIQERTANSSARRPRSARWRPRTGRTPSATGSTTTASPTAGGSRPPSCRPASTWTGWTRSPRPWTRRRCRARSDGSTTRSRPSC
ncbi:hypothetical protein GCM10020295_06370 [Streptomyces cinereospinus]